ncbi:MAG: hypothetical protein N3F65_04435 [Nitrososphaeria archaeon]|nr:hypothetical protein [Nitrososphaeria archaeon]
METEIPAHLMRKIEHSGVPLDEVVASARGLSKTDEKEFARALFRESAKLVEKYFPKLSEDEKVVMITNLSTILEELIPYASAPEAAGPEEKRAAEEPSLTRETAAEEVVPALAKIAPKQGELCVLDLKYEALPYIILEDLLDGERCPPLNIEGDLQSLVENIEAAALLNKTPVIIVSKPTHPSPIKSGRRYFVEKLKKLVNTLCEKGIRNYAILTTERIFTKYLTDLSQTFNVKMIRIDFGKKLQELMAEVTAKYPGMELATASNLALLSLLSDRVRQMLEGKTQSLGEGEEAEALAWIIREILKSKRAPSFEQVLASSRRKYAVLFEDLGLIAREKHYGKPL